MIRTRRLLEAKSGLDLFPSAPFPPPGFIWTGISPWRKRGNATVALVRGPIHGVPFAAKDIMDTANLPTEYGSPIYKGNRPTADAACVALSPRSRRSAVGQDGDD